VTALLARLRRSGDDGATMVEYGLLVALVAVIALLAVTRLGGQISGSVDKTCRPITTGTPGATPPVTC
jgi:pilus assembly protein Flp/PilA